jgi:hypothetical protein
MLAKPMTHGHGYGFSAGPNSRTHTRTRDKTRGKPAGIPGPVQFTTEGQYEHYAWLCICTDTFSCLGTDPQPSAVSLCPWVPEH